LLTEVARRMAEGGTGEEGEGMEFFRDVDSLVERRQCREDREVSRELQVSEIKKNKQRNWDRNDEERSDDRV